MKRHGNTLYVTTQGMYVARQNETLVLRRDKQPVARFPIHTLDHLICFGNVSVSPFALGMCATNNVGVSFLSERGRFLAHVTGPASGNVLLRRQQYRLADRIDDACPQIARSIILAKIANSRTVLLRALRDHDAGPGQDRIKTAADALAEILQEVQQPMGLEALLGCEGEAARHYFGVFDDLIRSGEDSFRFAGRSRRPPRDAVNALLSFLYTILASEIRSACETVGLDPQVGFLHRDRPGRHGLALDLMEEFRPMLADRLALSLINRKQVAPAGFETSESGAVVMDEKTRKAVLVAWQKRKAEEVVHPFLAEKMTIGLLPHVQARLLARTIRGDLDSYPSFFWK